MLEVNIGTKIILKYSTRKKLSYLESQQQKLWNLINIIVVVESNYCKNSEKFIVVRNFLLLYY